MFSETCPLFHFPYHTYPASFPPVAHSSAKYRGYTHTWSYQVAPASCRQAFRLASEPAGCRRYPSTERDGQAHPLQILPTPSFPLHTKTNLVCPLFPIHTQKQGGTHPPKNVGAPTFVIFPLQFHTFLVLSGCKGLAQVRRSFSEGGFPRFFLSPPKFAPKLLPISQYTSLTGPLFP